MPQELKLRATFDTKDVGTGAKAAVGSINAIEAASQRASAEIRRLQAEQDDLIAQLSGNQRAYPARTGGIRLTKAAGDSAAGGEGLSLGGKQIRGLGALERFAGVTGIESTINLIRSLPAIVGGLSAATIGAGLGITAALVPVYVAFTQYKKLLATRAAAAEFGSNETHNITDRLRKNTEAGLESGAIRGERGAALLQEIANLNKAQIKSDELRKNGGTSFELDKYIASERTRLIKEHSALVGVTYATEAAAAEGAAKAELEAKRSGYEAERALLENQLSRNLISRQEYSGRLKFIAGKEAASEQNALDAKEAALKAQLERSANDVEGAAKVRVELQALASERAQIDARRSNKIQAAGFQAQVGPTFRAQPVAVDDLARIGLFRGGGGETQASLLKQQVDLLKDANRTLTLSLEATRAI